MGLQLTAGQRCDSLYLAPVLDRISVPRPGRGRPRTRPVRVLADKGYPSRANRAYLRKCGIQAVIPGRRDQRGNRNKRYRAVSTRYDELAVRYEATLHVDIILDWKQTSPNTT